MKKLLLLALVMLGGVMQANADDKWVIAGPLEFMGSDYDGNDSRNALVQSNGNIYVLTKDITVSEDKWFSFKAVQNGSTWWNFNNVAGGTNNDATILVPSGSTKISFVFDISTHKGYAFTDKTSLSLKGTFWDDWTVDNVLSPTDNYGIFTFEKNDFLATGATTYEYRVWINNGDTYNMDNNLPISVTSNQTYKLNESQKYDLTFTVNLLKNSVSLQAKRVVKLGDSGMGTFSSVDAYNFADIDGLTAYYVSELTPSSATLSPITAVPPYNGILLKGAKNGRYTIPFGSATGSIEGNKLWAATTETDIIDGFAYILSNGEFHPANAGKIPAGKAYLKASDIPSTNARSLSLIFENETNGIGNVETIPVQDNVYYNLAGQRIVAPSKGMYIINGKKVIIK